MMQTPLETESTYGTLVDRAIDRLPRFHRWMIRRRLKKDRDFRQALSQHIWKGLRDEPQMQRLHAQPQIGWHSTIHAESNDNLEAIVALIMKYLPTILQLILLF